MLERKRIKPGEQWQESMLKAYKFEDYDNPIRTYVHVAEIADTSGSRQN